MLFPLFLVALQSYCKDEKKLLRMGAWTLVVLLVADVLIFHTHPTADLKQARDINVFITRRGREGNDPRDTGFYVCGGNLQYVQKA